MSVKQATVTFLKQLVQRVRPTVDSDIEVQVRVIDSDKDGPGLEVLTDTGTADPEPVLDLFYVREDDLGHVVKAVRFLIDGVTKDELYFYAHGHTLGCLLLN